MIKKTIRFKYIFVLLTILILFLIYKLYTMEEKKMEINNNYYFVLLDKNFKSRIKNEIVNDISNKKFQKIIPILDEMLTDLKNIDDSKDSNYKSYYEGYEQLLTYHEHVMSHKELAFNVLNQFKKNILKNEVDENDIYPFLDFLMFKKYSLYFRKEWYCLPYLRFSNTIFTENNIQPNIIFDTEANYKNSINLYDLDENDNEDNELQRYYYVNQKQIEVILNNMKNGKKETNNEFYVFYNTLLKAKSNDFILVYTVFE